MKKVLILMVLILTQALVMGEDPLSPNLSQQKYPARVSKNNGPKTQANNFPR